jgi:hypothetical protein
LCSIKYCTTLKKWYQINEHEMGGICSTHDVDEKPKHKFQSENTEKGDRLGCLSIDERAFEKYVCIQNSFWKTERKETTWET